MKTYELFLMLAPSFDESSANRFLKDLESTLSKFDVKFDDINFKGKQNIGYEIGAKKSAFQIIIKLTAKPEDISAIKERMKLVEDLLRFEIYNLQVLAS